MAGTAAPVWAKDSTFSNTTVKETLHNTADDLGSVKVYGYGLVNATEATTDVLANSYPVV